MEFIIVITLLFILILLYFKIADKYNIIDKPNHRSAHTQITLRGGGIIFPIAFIIFCLFNFNEAIQNYWSFGLGLLAICTISFIDDIRTLSNRIRLSIHLISVVLLLYFTGAFTLMPFWAWPILFVIIIGTLNAYNFMDGINGMTGVYSFVTLGSLVYINKDIIQFTDEKFYIVSYFSMYCLSFF
jgi:UDP-N-acetylmuramyl pentapeptide phosphotransferase/UDP-N-acetylglucosamine-1-phosphate transferase